MNYDVSFGQVTQPQRPVRTDGRFRLAILGDFSGRANAGILDIGKKLAARKPIEVDVDDLDDVLARFKLNLRLPLGQDGETVAVPIGSLDDFHPDQLVENVELFESLLTLRRNLGSKAGFARAAKEVLSWSGEEALPRPPVTARGATVATDLRLDDFARLTGRKPAATAEADVDDLVRRLVGRYVQPARDPAADQLIAQVDDAISAAMRRVLHHPDFQALEAVWRTVEVLVRRLETGARLQIVLYDVSAEEWASDLASTDALETTGLYGMLAEQPSLDADAGPFSAVIGLYALEPTPPHADLLGRMAQIAAMAGAPFVTGIDADSLQTPMHEQHPLIRQAWSALTALPASRYLGLAATRFLLRMPYGRKSDPIDAFKFEEFTRESGLSGMLWANPAAAVGLLLAQAWIKSGAKMQLGQANTIGDVPYYVYVTPEGDQVALPCTERLWSERQAAAAAAYNVMPLVSLRGRPEIRLAGSASVAGGPLAGPWAPVTLQPTPSPAPVATQAAPVAAAAATPAILSTEATPPDQLSDQPSDEPGADDADLDALLAGLDAIAEPPPAAEIQQAAPETTPEAADDGMADLDALLASLGTEPEPAAEGETETDLDALLASL